MTIDQQIAAALGFPKPKYMVVEQERRWIACDVPHELVLHTEAITDLYVTGTRLRLREARRTDTGAAMLRLTRKADVDAQHRLVTSIYLAESEFAVLAVSLPGIRISKLRHRLRSPAGVSLAMDEFSGDLAGLLILEAEFETDDHMRDFAIPDFAAREVTDDPRTQGRGSRSAGVQRIENRYLELEGGTANAQRHGRGSLSLRGSRVRVQRRAELDTALPLRKLSSRYIITNDDVDFGSARRIPIQAREAAVFRLIVRCPEKILCDLRIPVDLRERKIPR